MPRYIAVPIYPTVFGKYGVMDQRSGSFIENGVFKGKGCKEKAEALARRENANDERKSKRPENSTRFSERGNIFFMLFGAVALVGVLAANTNLFMRGPVVSAHNVVQHDKADTQILMAGRMVLVDALAAPANACSASAGGVPQPLVPASCTGPSSPIAGGGCLPATGGPKSDPWGSAYSYCAWVQGSSDPTKCPGLLVGQNPAGAVLVAIVSAGKDRVFQSTCGDAPNYVTTPSGSDDIVQIFSPAESGVIANGIATSFVKLVDAPSSYSGHQGNVVTVNAAGSGLQFSPLAFSGLTDVPLSYTGQGGKFVRVAGSQDGLVFSSASFFDLNGVLETAFTGHAGGLVRVNSAASGLAFSSLGFRDLADVPGSYFGQAGKVLRVSASENSVVFSPFAFTGLVDSPGGYAGQAGKSVRVSPGENSLEYYQSVVRFLDLADAPHDYTGAIGKMLRVNAAGTGLEFVSGSVANAGTISFTGLTDAPSSYSGSALKAVRVNATASGIEFYAPSASSMTFTSLSDAPASYSGKAGYVVVVNPTANGLVFSTLGAAAGSALNLDDLGDVITNYGSGASMYLGQNVGASATGAGNTAIGVLSFVSAVAAANNTFLGYKAGWRAQNAASNTAIGYQAMANVTSGGSSGGNVAIGANAGGAITGGSLATLVGTSADVDNPGSNYSTAMGYNAKAGSNSVAVGAMALKSLAASGAGVSNTALGYNAGALVTSGANNTIVGAGVGSTVLTTGSSNILIGTSAAVTTPIASTSDYLNIGNLITGDLTATGVAYVSSTGALKVPVGTAAQRPASPVNGMIRFNSDNASYEGANGGIWGPLAGGSGGGIVAVFTYNNGTFTLVYGTPGIANYYSYLYGLDGGQKYLFEFSTGNAILDQYGPSPSCGGYYGAGPAITSWGAGSVGVWTAIAGRCLSMGTGSATGVLKIYKL